MRLTMLSAKVMLVWSSGWSWLKLAPVSTRSRCRAVQLRSVDVCPAGAREAPQLRWPSPLGYCRPSVWKPCEAKSVSSCE